MSVGIAWTILGFDAQEVFSRLARLPRAQRVEAARKELEVARKSAKRLLSVYHPDQGGDPEKFKRVQQALQALEKHTEEFANRMSASDKEDEEKAAKRPFIKFGE